MLPYRHFRNWHGPIKCGVNVRPLKEAILILTFPYSLLKISKWHFLPNSAMQLEVCMLYDWTRPVRSLYPHSQYCKPPPARWLLKTAVEILNTSMREASGSTLLVCRILAMSMACRTKWLCVEPGAQSNRVLESWLSTSSRFNIFLTCYTVSG